MNLLPQQLEQLIQDCLAIPTGEQAAYSSKGCSLLLAEYSLNPTGDDPVTPAADELKIDELLKRKIPQAVLDELTKFTTSLTLLNQSREQLAPEVKNSMADKLRLMTKENYLHSHLADKFKIPANRKFLEKALQNSASVWQIAMVANWVLSKDGIEKFEDSTWKTNYPALNLSELIELLVKKITFQHIPTLRAYRKDAMHHYPRLSNEEFSQLKSTDWKDVIDFPSGRRPEQDIPFITPFIKQGDIEHSLYRHFMMPDLCDFMRSASPERSADFDLEGGDRNILLSLPIVIQQLGEELYDHVKNTIAGQIMNWAEQCQTGPTTEVSEALTIIYKLWDYKRTPAASDCNNPVDNLTKGFTATIRNGFGHFSDVNFAASSGSKLDPMDVSEKFVLFASVSNGQLDNLASAHRRYINTLPNPAEWNNESFFQHFLEVNRETDLHHIQGHFVVDKTRGCPAIPQIARYHGIMLDLALDYMLNQFGEENLRNAGDWYLKEKVPV